MDASERELVQHRIDELMIRLAIAEDELRATSESLAAEHRALAVAERLLAKHEEARRRYRIATGRVLRAA
jgi:hypothetical protein